MIQIKKFFDSAYTQADRYWWTHGNHYELSPSAHTPMNATLLNLLHMMTPKKTALDLGAGEGADAIRLAKMGFSVIAVEMSCVGAEKIRRFSREEGVATTVVEKDISSFEYPGIFDVILCHGVLHYIKDKTTVLNAMKAHTAPCGINSISCFSNTSPIPNCHTIIPVYPDIEDGEIIGAYPDWDHEFVAMERDVPEQSHGGFEPHVHSFIKLIARKPISTIS